MTLWPPFKYIDISCKHVGLRNSIISPAPVFTSLSPSIRLLAISVIISISIYPLSRFSHVHSFEALVSSILYIKATSFFYALWFLLNPSHCRHSIVLHWFLMSSNFLPSLGRESLWNTALPDTLFHFNCLSESKLPNRTLQLVLKCSCRWLPWRQTGFFCTSVL